MTPAAVIAIVGATGATGRRVSAAVAQRGGRLILIARDPQRLERMRSDLGSAVIGVACTDAHGLAGNAHALDGADCVVSCVAPYAATGLVVAEAALCRRLHYVDLAGDPAFIRMLDSQLHERAVRAGRSLIPAAGASAVPGCVAAVLAARATGELTALRIGVQFSGYRPTAGSILGLPGLLAASADLHDTASGDSRSIPLLLAEQVLMARRWPQARVETRLRVESVPAMVVPALDRIRRIASWIVATRSGRRIADALCARLSRRIGAAEPHADSGLHVWACAHGRRGTAHVSAAIHDIYGFSADSAATLALIAARGQVAPGLRDPADALGDDLATAASSLGITLDGPRMDAD